MLVFSCNGNYLVDYNKAHFDQFLLDGDVVLVFPSDDYVQHILQTFNIPISDDFSSYELEGDNAN